MRYGKSVWLGFAALAGVLLCAGATWSEPSRGETACSSCNRRVAALETRVARLEKLVAALQARAGTAKTVTAPAKTAPAPARAKTARAPARAATAPQGEAGRDNVKAFPPVGGCSPPYTVDASGIRQPKAGCEDVQSSPCDPPYVIDAQGLRRPKPECLR